MIVLTWRCLRTSLMISSRERVFPSARIFSMMSETVPGV